MSRKASGPTKAVRPGQTSARPDGLLSRVFPMPRPVIGMVHLAALPGSPGFSGKLEEVVSRALTDAQALLSAGVDGLLVENFGDTPFHKESVPPITVAAMTRAVVELQAWLDSAPRGLPLGVNVLRNDARSALAVAGACAASFIRVNVHVGAAATDQGVIEGRADETLRLRPQIAPGVAILADVRVKHARPLVERPVEEEVADLVERGRADGVLVTGARTGAAPGATELAKTRKAAGGRVPVWVASGISERNAANLADLADGFIVGSAFKTDGQAEAPVDLARAKRIVSALRADRRRGRTGGGRRVRS